MRDISTIISIGGNVKCGLSASSSDRGGISSIALVPNTARSRMYWSHIATVQPSYELVFGR